MNGRWIDDDAAMRAAADRIGRARRIAVDVESNGMFVFEPRLCTVQIAAEADDGTIEVTLVDALAVDIAPLAAAFADPRVPKIVHDATFDAAMLAKHGAPLDHVVDTAIAARLVGHAATGLASVLSAELGVAVDKKLQTSDWAARPLPEAALAYLVDDVIHLPALASVLWAKAEAQGIVEELTLECAHRLETAIVQEASLPPFARVKGFRTLGDDRARVLLRELTALRERLAREIDVPAGRLLSRDALFALIAASARGKVEISRYVHHRDARAAFESLLHSAARPLDEDEQALFRGPPPPDKALVARRKRADALLTRFRRDAAAERNVSEQVVLPGHLLRELAAELAAASSADDMRRALASPRVGEKRRALYEDAIVGLFDELSAAPSTESLGDEVDEVTAADGPTDAA